MSNKIKIDKAPNEFNDILPRSIYSEVSGDREKTGQSFTGGTGMGFNPFFLTGATGGFGNNIYRNPNRRFYDPEITTTAIYLPRVLKQKNRWKRWFYDHDGMVGTVLDLHAELPHSRAEVICDDPKIKREVEECLDRTNFFSMLPLLDLEFMKIGEVFIHTTWNESLGMWDHIIPHNPDFVDVKFSPFADQEAVIELKPDEQLRQLIHSTNPEDQQLKKRLPKDVVKRVLTGRNIILNPEEVTHLARRSNPYDVRGTGIIERIFRDLMYEDKLREAQMTIADNFIYPLKLFKLGDKQKGWIPDESHQRALAQMLQESNFDPNFSLIYHYGLDVEYITVADKVMKLDKEYTELTERKMIALGVSKQFISGDSTYAAANVGLQIQLARYKAKRDMFESRWIMDKFFRVMAERNGWYKRDARELVGSGPAIRIKRGGEESRQRLIVPRLMWHKKLMMRDDQAFLTFLNNVYAQGKGPISTITLLMAMGLDLDDELQNKTKARRLEEQIGALIHPQAGGSPPPGMSPGGAPSTPPPPIASRILDRLKLGFSRNKNKSIQEIEKEVVKISAEESKEFVAFGVNNELKFVKEEKFTRDERENITAISKSIPPVSDDEWKSNLRSPILPPEVALIFSSFDNKLAVIQEKEDDFVEGIKREITGILKPLVEIYLQGKLASYNWTAFLPIYKEYYAEDDSLKDFSDIVLANEFEDWIHAICTEEENARVIKARIRDLGNTCFCYGQLKGFQEQGIYSVKVSNVPMHDGFRYKTSELLGKNRNLASVVSPRGDIIVLAPCIEGFDAEELENNIDPHIKRYKNFTIASIKVKDCPTEFAPFVERYLLKVGKYLKNDYNSLVFVKDVIETELWNEITRKKLEQKYALYDEKMKGVVVSGEIMQERTKKIGKTPTFSHDKTLYISNWIGMEDFHLTDMLLTHIPLDGIEKVVTKTFKHAGYHLSSDELTTYKIFGYIKPIMEGESTVMGWEINPDITKYGDSVDQKIVYGKIWDASGKCIGASAKDPMQVFNETAKLWIEYPHKLNEEQKSYYSNI